LHLHDREVNTSNPPDKIPTSKDSELIATEIGFSQPRQEDSTGPPQQAGADMDRSPTENEGLCPHERVGNKPDCPGKAPTSEDPELIMSEKSQSQPRQKDRTALNGTEPPLHHTPDHPLTPIIKGGRGQLPGPNTAQEPDGLILDSNSAITGFTEFTYTASPEPSMQREEQLLEKYAPHATDTPTLQHATDTPTLHSMHTAPPAPRHPRHDSDTMQNSLNEKYMHMPAP